MARPTRSSDWGFPRWRGYGRRARGGGRCACVTVQGAMRKGRLPCAQIAQQPGPVVFLRGSTLPNTIRAGTTSKGSTRKRRKSARRPSAAIPRAIGRRHGPNGAARAMAAAAATRLRALETLGLDPDADFEAVKQGLAQQGQGSPPRRPPRRQGRSRAVPEAASVLRSPARRRRTPRVEGLRLSLLPALRRVARKPVPHRENLRQPTGSPPL